MKIRKGLALPVTTALLLCLLGILQYHWLGQVSHAQALQMRRLLARATDAAAMDFDKEITRAFNFFIVGVFEHRDRAAALVTRRTAWRAQAPYPGLVSAVYLLRFEDDAWRLLMLDDQDTWVPVPWPENMDAVRMALEHPDPRGDMPPPSTLFGDVPALMAPPAFLLPRHARMQERVHREHGPPMRRRIPRERPFGAAEAVVVVFDPSFINDHLLPDLMARAFPADQGPVPDFEITHRYGAHERVAGRGRVPAGAGYETEMLKLRGFADISPDLGPPPEADQDDIAWRDSRLFQHYSELARHLYALALSGTTEGGWVLRVAHKPGELDRAVAQARTRNLVVAFSILLLLAAAVMLVWLSAERARRLADRQLEFVAGITHELLTPLAGVHGAGQNLSAGVVKDPGRIAEYGRMIERETGRLSSMIRQVLDYANLRGGHRTAAFQELDAAAVLREGLADCAVPLQGFAQEIDIPDNLGMVQGDPMALRRVMQNLLGNVAKYAHEGRWLGVTARRVGNRVRVTVRDRGPGIDPEDRKHLFQPFYRGKKQVAGTVPGSGLGLCLVDRIVTAHGGTVRVPPSEQGACFEITLPCLPRQEGDAL